jgi:hypothetical protein
LLPSRRIVQMWHEEWNRQRSKTMREPSGDQSGSSSTYWREACVIVRWPLPSLFATRMCAVSGVSCSS